MKKYILILILLLSAGLSMTAQTFSDDNFIYTVTPKKPVQAGSFNTLTKDEMKQSITYFDGLGRPIQTTAINQGADNSDIVTPIEYDAFGRQVKEYLPYSVPNAATAYPRIAMSSSLTSLNSLYNSLKYENTSNPYSEKEFEASPLNRVLRQAAPGDSWKLNSGHEIKLEYQTNTADEVKLFAANTSWDTTQKLYNISLSNDEGGYPAGELYKNITKDENWTSASGNNNTVEEFKDKEGRVVLKRTFNNQIAHDTYYVYDIYGNLTYVLPPKAVDLIGNSTTAQADVTSSAVITSGNTLALTAANSITLSNGFHAQAGSIFSAVIVNGSQSVLDNLCYQYKYDHRNRLVEKKLPGKDWEYIVYDKLDRPILTQDANLKKQNKWLFTKYDAFNRPVYTGEYTKTTQNSRAEIQASADSSTALFENKQTAALNINNTAIYYSNNAFPNTNDITIFTISYYDNYEFDLNGGVSENVGTITPITNTKSLATGSKVRILGTSNWITNVIYYDQKARPIYNYSRNDFLNVTQKVKSELDFIGKPNQTTTQHIKGNTTITIADTFTYDHADRLKKHTQSINGAAAEVIAENTYDELGQLITKGVGGKGSSRLQTVDYTYNIRGWLKGINDVNAFGTDLFAFQINYNNPTDPAKALYNGNISQTFWKTQNQDTSLKNYTYSYDALNRLTNAVSQDNGRYNESLSYDKNGNIMTLLRNGYKDANASVLGEMDNLVYTYNTGNKLFKVKDNSSSTEGFKDGADTAQEYSYDANGNIITDANKGITAITYNHLNLPAAITLAAGTIQYEYDAAGGKQRKTVSGITTDYAGGFQYEQIGTGNSELKFFPTTEGYVKNDNGNYSYIYQYKDHLGNVRLSYGDSNNDGIINSSTEIVEANHYYPFGLKQKIAGEVNNQSNYKYKYNGKELQEELGLNMYDYGSRLYDPARAGWSNIDPLAEKMRRWSPYNYCFDNPMRFIDPDGMSPNDWRDKNGNLVYDTRTGSYTRYATADHKRFGNSLLQTSTGRTQFNKLVNSNIPITTEISAGSGPSTGSQYITGETFTTRDGTGKATKAKIVIYEGRIKDWMKALETYYNAGTESKLSVQSQLYHDNTTTMDEKVSAVAGHEIEHATSEENRKLSGTDKEKVPEEVETQILKEIPASKPVELKPVPVVIKPVEIKAPIKT